MATCRTRCWERIVVGIKDKSLSEKLQLDSELNLERAVTQVRNAELVRLQQKELQESHHPKIVERVQLRPRNNSNSERCPACGYWCLKNQHRCPAVSARCYQCGKSGHFRRMCNMYVSSIERNETESVSDKGYFVGTGTEPDIFIWGETGGASFATRGAVNGLCRTFRKKPEKFLGGQAKFGG